MAKHNKVFKSDSDATITLNLTAFNFKELGSGKCNFAITLTSEDLEGFHEEYDSDDLPSSKDFLVLTTTNLIKDAIKPTIKIKFKYNSSEGKVTEAKIMPSNIPFNPSGVKDKHG